MSSVITKLERRRNTNDPDEECTCKCIHGLIGLLVGLGLYWGILYTTRVEILNAEMVPTTCSGGTHTWTMDKENTTILATYDVQIHSGSETYDHEVIIEVKGYQSSGRGRNNEVQETQSPEQFYEVVAEEIETVIEEQPWECAYQSDIDLLSDQPIVGDTFTSPLNGTTGFPIWSYATRGDFHFGEIPPFGFSYYLSVFVTMISFSLVPLVVTYFCPCGFEDLNRLCVVWIFQLQPLILLSKVGYFVLVHGGPQTVVVVFTVFAFALPICGCGVYLVEKVATMPSRRAEEERRREELAKRKVTAAIAAVSDEEFASLLEVFYHCSSAEAVVTHLQHVYQHAADSRMTTEDKQALVSVGSYVQSNKVEVWTMEVAQAFRQAMEQMNTSVEIWGAGAEVTCDVDGVKF